MTTISAKIIADSVNHTGHRITTMQLRYPRCIHAEFMTHRMFSRNASSSRAVPVSRLISDIEEDPFVPMFWGKNQKGMQAGEEHNKRIITWDGEIYSREEAWTRAAENALEMARYFSDAGYHKQIVNRLLEPFSHINVVVTATEWANFYALRRHPDAEPHIHLLANRMWEAQQESIPKLLEPGEWHLPYITMADVISGLPQEELALVSVARCARVSYVTHEGKSAPIRVDFDLAKRLLGSVPLHASPAEHQAMAYSADRSHLWSGNFRGWYQFRKSLPNENITE